MADLTGTTCPGVGCVTFDVSNHEFIGVQLTGTFSADVAFTASIDNTNYKPVGLLPAGVTNAIAATTASTTGVWRNVVAGLRTVRVAATAFTSGTITVTASAVK